ncbi:hypothetical protein [Kitasatospora cystarginea]|uniref:hypothetical protein n=1 Tax=Kitasatospora cystarginea TaxID=58350 RepID=UPI0031E291C8
MESIIRGMAAGTVSRRKLEERFDLQPATDWSAVGPEYDSVSVDMLDRGQIDYRGLVFSRSSEWWSGRFNLHITSVGRPAALFEALSQRLPHVRDLVAQIEREVLTACEHCERPAIPPPTTRGGRPRRYCSNACRQAAYRARKRFAAWVVSLEPT